jgi:hypothetical protein
MIEISEDDYRPLETFSMAWRWTDSRHTLLPGHELANIRPLTNAKASEIADRILVFRTDEDILPVGFELVDQVDASDIDIRPVREWLLNRDDFCYSSSDDVVIIPLSEEWILFYWHEEVFYFGRRTSIGNSKQQLGG